MLRRILTPFASLILLLVVVPVQAAETALDAVASEASLVIRLKKPKATLNKVADLVDLVVKGQGDSVRGKTEELGKLISNPNLVGVDTDADWFVAVYTDDDEEDDAKKDEKKDEKKDGDEEEDDNPTLLFIVPATDLAAMEKELGDSFKFMKHGKFGVYTKDEATAKATAARLKGEGKSISTLIDKDSNAVFDGGDVSVFINVKQLASDYKEEIEKFQEDAKQQLENLPANAAGAPGGMNTQQMAQLVGQLMKGLSTALADTQSCTVAAVISKDGLAFDDLVKVKAGSATDKLLAKSAPGALSTLSLLPAGYLGYLGFTWNMSDIAEFNKYMMGIGGAALKPETAKELEGALADMAKLKISSLATAFGLGDIDEGAVRSVSVTEVDNPAKMRELTQKVIKAMQGVETQGIKQTYTVKKDAEKYDKNSADVTTVKTEMVDQDNPLMAQMMERMMSAMFGPDGMTTRQVYLKDKVVQTMGGGKQAMKDSLAALEKSSESSKSPFQQSRAKLGAKSNLVVLVDLTNTIAKIVDLVVQSQAVPIPLDAEQVKNLQQKPSFFGISAGTEPQGLRVKTVVPVEQMQGIARIVNFVQQSLMGGAGGEN
ncbi:MAG TPA: hypothetical protein VGH74_07865 [Planctomycetaceae bacterium]